MSQFEEHIFGRVIIWNCRLRSAIIAVFLLLLAGCSQAPSNIKPYDIVHTYPHDPAAFTQGLLYLDGVLYESTGLNGQSSLRKVDLPTGKVLELANLQSQYFAEGLAELHGKLYQLTWQNQTAFVYDLKTFKQESQFFYSYEGWGLTSDGTVLILSDGSDQIRFIDPGTFTVQRTIHVTEGGHPISNLNELEYIKGEIFANIWQTDDIVRINPKTGEVTSRINFSGLLDPQERPGTDVLNGIAYDAATDRLFITGKLWPKLFEIRLKPATGK